MGFIQNSKSWIENKQEQINALANNLYEKDKNSIFRPLAAGSSAVLKVGSGLVGGLATGVLDAAQLAGKGEVIGSVSALGSSVVKGAAVTGISAVSGATQFISGTVGLDDEIAAGAKAGLTKLKELGNFIGDFKYGNRIQDLERQHRKARTQKQKQAVEKELNTVLLARDYFGEAALELLPTAYVGGKRIKTAKNAIDAKKDIKKMEADMVETAEAVKTNDQVKAINKAQSLLNRNFYSQYMSEAQKVVAESVKQKDGNYKFGDKVISRTELFNTVGEMFDIKPIKELDIELDMAKIKRNAKDQPKLTAEQKIEDAKLKMQLTKYRIPKTTIDFRHQKLLSVIKDRFDPARMTPTTKEKLLGLQETELNLLSKKDLKQIKRLDKVPLADLTIADKRYVKNLMDQIKVEGRLQKQYDAKIYKDRIDGLADIVKQNLIPVEKVTDVTRKEMSSATNLLETIGRAERTTVFANQAFDTFSKQKGFNNPVLKNIKGILDKADNALLDFISLQKKHIENITDNFQELKSLESRQRVHLYALKQQPNTKDYLDYIAKSKEHPFTKKDIDELKLTKKEMEFYKLMRNQLDSVHPVLASMKKFTKNEELGYIDQYFPVGIKLKDGIEKIDDWIDAELAQFYHHSNPGFVKYSRKNTMDKDFEIELDALTVYNNYIQSAAKYMFVKPATKQMFDIWQKTKGINKYYDEFMDKYIQNINAPKTTTAAGEVLRTLKNNMTKYRLFFKFSTAAIQPSAYLEAGSMLGTNAPYFAKITGGLVKNPSKAKKELAMIKNKLPQLRGRAAGEEAFAELVDSLADPDTQKGMKKFVDGVTKKGADIIQWIDGNTATVSAYGFYRVGKDKLKLSDADALDFAEQYLVRTQGSSRKKDLPILFTGRDNFSEAAKVYYTFKTFALNRYSNFRANNWKQNVMFSLGLGAAAMYSDMVYRVNDMITGREDDQDYLKALGEQYVGEIIDSSPVSSVFNSFDLFNNYNSQGLYTGTYKKAGKGLYNLGKAMVTDDTMSERDFLNVLEGVGAATGVPGGKQAIDFYKGLTR